MSIIIMAIPGFFILILLELAWDQYKKSDTYRINDAINSLAMGTLSRISGLLYAAIPFSLYVYLYEDYTVFSWNTDSIWPWVTAFILYDLGYYWSHRMGHTLNIAWASHVIHHSSEEYNLTTALRQTSVPNVIGWVFFLPLALLGLPPVILITVAALNLIYQFWVHTQHINKMPNWFEAVFVTPSNHRVHHGKNKIYIDKNHGGVFILWDRFFGTFQAELDNEKVVFGISTQLASWNPVWGNVKFLNSLMFDAWHTKSWFDKFTLWFRRTGYRPQDMEDRFPIHKTNEAVIKYDTTISTPTKIYALLQLMLSMAFTLAFVFIAKDLDLIQLITGAFVLVFSLVSISMVQSLRPRAIIWEAFKFIGFMGCAYWLITGENWVLISLLMTGIASCLTLLSLQRKNLEIKTA